MWSVAADELKQCYKNGAYHPCEARARSCQYDVE